MNVTEIEMHRDGGTITFRLLDDPALEGRYRLQTPRLGEPRPMFRDEVQLAPGSAEENTLAIALERWLKAALSPERANALRDLDQLSTWHNLPERLVDVVPLHRLRAVIGCLQDRRRT